MANKKEIELKIKSDTNSLTETKNKLKELKAELLTIDDVDVFAQKAAEASELQDSLNRVNGQIALLASSGTPMTQFSNALGSVGSSLASLDFDAALESAKAMSIVSKNINFGTAISSLKTLGKTFLTVGKAILTNPLFLLVAIIVAIVVAIYKFLDALGVIKWVVEKVGKAIDWIIGLFKALTDWMGITSHAAQEEANKTAEAWEDAAQRKEKSSASIVRSLDHQIRMAKLEGKDVEEMERLKRKEIDSTMRMRMMADKAAFNAAQLNTDMAHEEKVALKKKAEESRIAYSQSLRDTQYFEAQIAKTKIDEAQKTQKELDDIQKKADDDADKARKDAIQKAKEYNKNRLDTSRLAIDLEFQMMTDGIEKEVNIQNEKYKRLIADTKNNEKLLASEKKKLIEYYNTLQIQTEKKLRDDNQKLEEEGIKTARSEYDKMIIGLNQNSFAVQQQELQNQYNEDISKFKEMLDKKIISQDEYNQAIIDLETDRKAKLAEMDSFDLGEELSPLEQAQLEADELLNIERAKLEAGLIDLQTFSDREAQIIEQLEKKKQDLDEETNKLKKEKFIATTNEIGSVAQQGLDAIGSLIESQYEMDIKNAEGNEKKQEALRKKAFEANKKMQIANAVISMAMGIVNAFSAPFPMNIVMAALAAVTGIASIIKIKSTTYQGGASAMTPPSPASVGDAPSMTSSSMFNNSQMSGTNNQTDKPSNTAQRVYVLESDIANTSNGVNQMSAKGEIM